MSDKHFPHPNEHPHDDDLQPERGADATISDADALDALLNGIAQGNGSPNTRPGQRHERPDVRDSDHDADLRAARAFHQRFEAARARDSGAAALNPTLWETIMAATTNQPERSPGNLWRNATGDALAASARPTRRTAPPANRGIARHWGGFANATLAIVIVLAGFGIWRFYDGLNSAGTPDPEPTTPGIAMQPGTPEATSVPAPPVSTPTPAYACDFSGDIPIIEQAASVPVQGTALRLTPGNELVLTCPEEPEGFVLATGITEVSPMFWPGTVHLFGEGSPGERPVSVLNVFTGQSLDLGPPPAATTYQWMQPANSPWFISSLSDSPGDWTIIDLRTMESRSYTDLTGATPLPDGTVLNANSNGSMLVITPWFSTYPGNAGTDPSHLLLDVPAALVIEGSLNDTRMISLPGDLAPISETQLAPDGKHLALKATDDAGGETIGKTTYSIVQTTDGAEVGRSATFDDPIAAAMRPTTTMHWVQGGAALAYTQGTALMLLPTAGDAPISVLEVHDHLGDLQTTGDPDVVVVHGFEEADLPSENPTATSHRLYSINTVTGEAIEVEGVDVTYRMSWDTDTRFLVMGDTRIMNMDAETASFRVVDAVTGEVLDELTNVEVSRNPNGVAMDLRTVASTDDGNVEVIGFNASQIFLIHMEEGGPEIRQLPAPNAGIASYVDSAPIWLSNDGSLLSLVIESDVSGNRYLIELSDPEAAWVVVPAPDGAIAPGYGTAPIQFMPGTGS